MPDCRLPSLPLPEPLRGAELGTFTHTSVAVRLPKIGRQTIADNHFAPAERSQLEALVDEISNGRLRSIRDDGAGDEAMWNQAIEPYLGSGWLEAPWFLVETYFYRRVLEATGYFRPGPTQGLDPYIKQKKAGLEASAGQIPELGRRQEELLRQPASPENLAKWLQTALWGNQADLSMWPAGSEDNGHAASQSASHLVVNDTHALAHKMVSLDGRFHIVLDNAGFELVCDLALVDALLTLNLAKSVVLHVKRHPTFVSDATEADLHQTLAALSENHGSEAARLAARLMAGFNTGHLRLTSPWFWNSPYPLWRMPMDLYQELSQAGLVLFKGDANYRRALGDLHWPYETPVEGILSYRPAPLALLRVLKAEIVVGLRQGKSEDLFRLDPDWLVDGHWGMVQYCE